MNILVLDDQEILRNAPEVYDSSSLFHDFREDTFRQTRYVREFVALFFTGDWDEIWINHDLADPPNTGRTATKEIYNYILGSGRKMVSVHPLIRIISMNPNGAEQMQSDLTACGFLHVLRSPISSTFVIGVFRGDTIRY